MLEHIWNGWRAAYVTGSVDSTSTASSASVFTQILESGLSDEDAHIVHRGPTCFVIMNAFPYTSGHLMVLPQRAVAELEDLADDEHLELWSAVRSAVVALKRAFSCDACGGFETAA